MVYLQMRTEFLSLSIVFFRTADELYYYIIANNIFLDYFSVCSILLTDIPDEKR